MNDITELFVIIMSGFFIHALWCIKEDKELRKALLDHAINKKLKL